MTTTGDKVLALLTHVERVGDGEYRAWSPLRDSDSPSFSLLLHPDGEHGAFHDFVSDRKGSLYALVTEMRGRGFNIELPVSLNGGARVYAPSTKRVYRGLADYAQAHGVTAEVFAAAGWHEVEYTHRPALQFPTRNGDRVRFSDGKEPKYLPVQGTVKTPNGRYAPCLYGFERATKLAKDKSAPLVICNGEASVIVAQHYGVPAFCQNNGENAFTDANLKEVTKDWSGKFLVALDCDDKGRAVSGKLVAQLGERAHAVDLGFTDHGDLADWCKLHQDGALPELLKLSPYHPPVATETQRLGATAQAVVATWTTDEEQASAYREGLLPLEPGKPFDSFDTPILQPFRVLQKFGGLAHVINPGKMISIAGTSGGTKSSFVETLEDAWRSLYALDIIHWGIEWTAQEMMQRAVQRYGGPSMTEYGLHQLWMVEEAARMPLEQRSGVRLPQSVIEAAQRATGRVESWSGRAHYIDDPITEIDALLAAFGDRIRELKAAGRKPRVCVLDYVQLLDLYSARTESQRITDILGKVKAFTVEHRQVMVFVTQVTKNDARNSAAGDGALDAEAGQFVRSDKSNLVITLNPEYDEDDQMTGRGVIKVAKNNLGRRGKVWVPVDPARLTWVDRELEVQKVSLKSKP